MANTTSTRAAAQAALDAYKAQDGVGNGADRENISDLITDLLHLADQLHTDALRAKLAGAADADDDTASGETIMDTVQADYFEERDASDEDDAEPFEDVDDDFERREAQAAYDDEWVGRRS